MAAVTAINAGALTIIGVILILVGLALAFWGRKVWTPFMSLVGAVIGGSVGYIIGGFYASSGYVVALALALIGSVLGSILFNYLVKIALALIAASIPAVLAYFALRGDPIRDPAAQDTSVIVAILVLLTVFVIAYYFVEELIGIVTSLVGGFLLGAGVFLAMNAFGLALGSGVGVFILGSIVQTLAIRTAKRGSVWRLRRARAVPVGPPPPPPPPPQVLRAPAPPPAPPPSNPSANQPPPPPP